MTTTGEKKKNLEGSAKLLISDIESRCEVFLKSSNEEIQNAIFKRLEGPIKAKGEDFVLSEFLKATIAHMEEEAARKLNVFEELIGYTERLHASASDVLQELILVASSHNLFEKEKCEELKRMFQYIDKRFVELNSLPTDNAYKLVKALSSMPSYKKAE